ncbi:hypothetical protein EIN_085700 [Entamoeba invadens IP1]|uniref:hypothetical protein n=1 Tax=Entamoeba invadens IP1 TaxID=370355 RepID=UPI0002C3D65C|nr:hypothetical protein EIN_085700 [Entamoeba invadens IP1]ELP85328.1 hypothetical protein EIN_085700 [Entamoeba invadens IP1]|eukprot:XP_004184674.1 hypothetical protein EIN_085700 [Entamoeba invadens IP1]
MTKPQTCNSAFSKKTLIRGDSNGATETWCYPGNTHQLIVQTAVNSQHETPPPQPKKQEAINFSCIFDDLKKYPYHGKTRKVFVGYCILIMKTLYNFCKAKEKTNSTQFKTLVEKHFNLPYQKAVERLSNTLDFFYSAENLGCTKQIVQQTKHNKIKSDGQYDKQVRIKNTKALSKKSTKSVDEKSLQTMLFRLERAIRCERFTSGPHTERIMSLRSMMDEMCV